MKAQIKHIADVACMGSTIEFTVVLDSLYRQDVFEVLNAMQGDKKPYTTTIVGNCAIRLGKRLTHRKR